jgi:hypothetical protein
MVGCMNEGDQVQFKEGAEVHVVLPRGDSWYTEHLAMMAGGGVRATVVVPRLSERRANSWWRRMITGFRKVPTVGVEVREEDKEKLRSFGRASTLPCTELLPTDVWQVPTSMVFATEEEAVRRARSRVRERWGRLSAEK